MSYIIEVISGHDVENHPFDCVSSMDSFHMVRVLLFIDTHFCLVSLCDCQCRVIKALSILFAGILLVSIWHL